MLRRRSIRALYAARICEAQQHQRYQTGAGGGATSSLMAADGEEGSGVTGGKTERITKAQRVTEVNRWIDEDERQTSR